MSNQQALDYVLNNGQRYVISIANYFKEKDFIVYQTVIFDTAFAVNYYLYFRFKTLKKLHEQILKHEKETSLPEFPKTKSFGLWNRTNRHPRLIQDRIRQLEYYLTKILNSPVLQKLHEVQFLKRSIKKNSDRRAKSEPKKQHNPLYASKNAQCPQLYKRSLHAVELL